VMAAKRSFSNVLSRQIGWGVVPPSATSFIRELPIVFGALGLLYSVIAFARYWASPVTAQADIDLHAFALPRYALFSLLRIAVAYFLSFVYSLSSTATSLLTIARLSASWFRYWMLCNRSQF
jgi:NitT/TauT family transport system permease protein